MASEDSGTIAGVDDQELATVTGLMTEVPDGRASRADRFAQAVRTLVEKRAQKGWPKEGAADMAVFVLVDYPRKEGQAHGGTPFADPVAQGTPLLGRLFFASADASHGHFIAVPTDEGAVLDWLEQNELVDRPIVTVYRDAKEMVTRRKGIRDSARSDAIRDKEPSATAQELLEALDLYHRSEVVTPTDCPDGVWNCARRYIPGPEPEKSIQKALRLSLNSWFRGVVRAGTEDTTKIGRIDVRLLKKEASGGLAYWIILELKVIKSYTSTGTSVGDSANVEAIVKGVKQAGAYRANRDAVEGMLEVYDLRQDKAKDLTTRQEVTVAAAKYSPRPRINVWPMYGSAEDARNAGEVGF